MRLTTISTGSKGNAYILEADGDSLILDAGISAKKVLTKVRNLERLAGVLITHEHQDHARHWRDFIERGIKTCMSSGTKEALLDERSALLGTAIATLEPMKAARLQRFTVMPFRVEHDAKEPFGFLIRYEPTGETALYATDTYYLRYTFPGVNYWIIECNYCDDELLNDSSGINAILYERLIQAHMSLKRLKDALAANDLSKTRKIALVHLSDTRSDEARMVREIEELTGVETEAARDGATINLELTPF